MKERSSYLQRKIGLTHLQTVLKSTTRMRRSFQQTMASNFRQNPRWGKGRIFLPWRDLSGDPGDLHEFMCDSPMNETKLGTFEIVAIQWHIGRERKRRRSHGKALAKQPMHISSVSVHPNRPQIHRRSTWLQIYGILPHGHQISS